MNQGIKYVEYVVNMKDNSVNNFCITLLPVSAGDGCKYSSYFRGSDHDFGQRDFQDTLYIAEREE
jgi:hypothetical protein